MPLIGRDYGLLKRARAQLAVPVWRRRLIFWSGAITIGATAVLFAAGSNWALSTFRVLQQRTGWWSYLALPVGLGACAWLTRRVFPGAEGSGIPQTIAALELQSESARDAFLSLRIAFGKIVLTLLALICGASVGREGPTVQVGASIMHFLRRFARFSDVDVDRGLILAGGAAGVAAAFNTPLAGVVFAIEELSRSFEEQSSGTILSAVIVAGVTSLALLGNYTYFGSTSATLGDAATWLVVPQCGLIGGILGGVFARCMLGFGHWLPAALKMLRQTRPVLFATSCGAVIAAIGWISSGSTYGTGYAEANALLQHSAQPAPAFAIWKALATMVSYLSGIPCGIFAPSLAVGAGLGAELHNLWPLASAGATTVLGMAAYFSGVVQAPLTALVIVAEMTGDRAMTLPLMAAALLGRAGSALVCQRPLYRSLSLRYMQDVRSSE